MGASSEISRAPCFGCGSLSRRSLSNRHTVIQSMQLMEDGLGQLGRRAKCLRAEMESPARIGHAFIREFRLEGDGLPSNLNGELLTLRCRVTQLVHLRRIKDPSRFFGDGNATPTNPDGCRGVV
jgi:hypothetical protein